MTRHNDTDIERMLRDQDDPRPPEGLRERLLEDIPDDLGLSEVESRRRRPRVWLAAAATVVAMIGGGVVIHQILFTTTGTVRSEFDAPGEDEREMRIEVLPSPSDDSDASTTGQDASEAQPEAAPAPTSAEGPDAKAGTRQAGRDQAETERLAGAAPTPGVSPGTQAAEPTSESPARRELASRTDTTAERDEEKAAPLVGNVRDKGPSDRKAPPSERMMQEVVVTAEPPVVDTTRTVTGQTFGTAERRPEDFISPAPQAPPSTGGTDEPNDRPYGDVFFEGSGVNPYVDTEDDRLSTFGLDVDTGSWGVVGRYLRDGHLPPHDAVRVEEIVNALDYGDPAPRRDDFAVVAEGAPSPWAPGPRYHLLRFAINARTVDPDERPAAALTFVIDTSGSMSGGGRLELVKDALELLLDRLRPSDRIAVIEYGSRARTVLEPTNDHGAVRRALRSLRPNGSTNAEAGLVLGYDTARRAFREGGINRVILCSDGVANVGRTGPGSILERIEAASRDGIELTTVGVGMGNYNDVLMEQLADRGDGRYVYVDDLAEARRVFSEELMGTLLTVAEEARVQVDFDPETVSRWRLLGYENRDIADERFRDDTVDAGEIGAGHTVTAVYSVKLRPEARKRDDVATLHLRYRPTGADELTETSRTLRVRDLARSWDEAPRGLRLATVAARFAEILRGSYWAKDGDLDDLLRRAQQLGAAYSGDSRVAELAHMIARARDLAEPEDEPAPYTR